jgi:hypothetical protein
VTDFLFDTNVLLDIATSDPVWAQWSERQLRATSSVDLICINPIIYAELAPAFASQAALEKWLDPAVFPSARAAILIGLAGSPGVLAVPACGWIEIVTDAGLLHWGACRK